MCSQSVVLNDSGTFSLKFLLELSFDAALFVRPMPHDINIPRVDRLCGDICSYVCPQTWLNDARTNIGLSPTMSFLNENDSLAYFVILRELFVVWSVLYCGPFQDFKFSIIVS